MKKISKLYKLKLWFQGNLRLLENETQVQYFHMFSHLIVSCQIFFKFEGSDLLITGC